MENIKVLIDNLYAQYRNNRIITDDKVHQIMLKSGNIDSTINDFNLSIRGIIQENIAELSNLEIETVTEYANNIMDNFRRITKREN